LLLLLLALLALLTLLSLLTLLPLLAALLRGLTLLPLLPLLAALLLLIVLPALLLLAAARGVVFGRRRGLREDDGGLSAVISLGQGKIIGRMGGAEAGEARQNGTCHQQTAELFHLMSYGCGVRPKPKRRAVGSKRARGGVGCMSSSPCT
jgi:hypothetical protein